MTSFWRGFTSMAATAGQEVVMVGGKRSTVWDEGGRHYLDGTASLWYCNVGHGRSEIIEAVTGQMQRLAVFHTFNEYANRPALDLADKVASIAPMKDAAVFFTPGGGSDAIDTAGKLARRYWAAVGKPEKQGLIARQHAYHGMNAYGTTLAGIPSNTQGFGELVEHVEHVGWDALDELEALLVANAGRIAAFIGEPVIGAGGILPPPDGYWPAVAELCLRHDVLLISDEVICGFGRLGTWFGCQRYDFTPDLMCCAKGLTSGYMPLGAVVAGPRVKDAFWGDAKHAPPFRHGYTYGGHPSACAAGLANIAIIERERLVDRVRELEPVLADAVRAEFEGHALVAEVRCAGLLAGVEVPAAALAAEPRLPDMIALRARRDHGLITRSIRGVALQLSPAFVTSPVELAEMARRLRAAFDDALRDDVPAGTLAAAA